MASCRETNFYREHSDSDPDDPGRNQIPRNQYVQNKMDLRRLDREKRRLDLENYSGYRYRFRERAEVTFVKPGSLPEDYYYLTKNGIPTPKPVNPCRPSSPNSLEPGDPPRVHVNRQGQVCLTSAIPLRGHDPSRNHVLKKIETRNLTLENPKPIAESPEEIIYIEHESWRSLNSKSKGDPEVEAIYERLAPQEILPHGIKTERTSPITVNSHLNPIIPVQESVPSSSAEVSRPEIKSEIRDPLDLGQASRPRKQDRPRFLQVHNPLMPSAPILVPATPAPQLQSSDNYSEPQPIMPQLFKEPELPTWLRENDFVSVSELATEVIFYNRTGIEQILRISGNVIGTLTVPPGNFYVCLCSTKLCEYKADYGIRFKCLSEDSRLEEMTNTKDGANRFKIVTKFPMWRVPKGLYMEVTPVRRDGPSVFNSKIICCSLNRNWALTGRAHTYNTLCTNFRHRPLTIQSAASRTDDMRAPRIPENAELRDPRLRSREGFSLQ